MTERERVVTLDLSGAFSSLMGMVGRGGKARKAALLQIAGATLLTAGAVLALELNTDGQKKARR